LAEGVAVHAVVRDEDRAGELAILPGSERLTLHAIDLLDTNRYRDLIAQVQPDELYNLAGMSSVRRSFEDPAGAWRSNAEAVHGLLEMVRTKSPRTRFYQASSTDMFGSEPGGTTIHDESSAFRPQSPYAGAKAAAHVLCDAYRRAFDLRVACGIVSNHESSRRAASFLTAKVAGYVRALRDAASPGDGSPGNAPDTEPLRVGNLAVRREWGYAPDYVDGIIRVCRQIAVRAQVLGGPPDPDVGASYRDYVLGTGRQTAVWELIDRAFALAGFTLRWDRSSPDPADWSARLAGSDRAIVVVDPALLRPADPATIGTDPSRARDELGWVASSGLDAILEEMLSGRHESPAAAGARAI
jgi:GDPmannose 4,6-dehydratase